MNYPDAYSFFELIDFDFFCLMNISKLICQRKFLKLIIFFVKNLLSHSEAMVNVYNNLLIFFLIQETNFIKFIITIIINFIIIAVVQNHLIF